MINAAEVLTSARELVRDHWVNHDPQEEWDRGNFVFCAYTAVSRSSSQRAVLPETSKAALYYLAQGMGLEYEHGQFERIFDWNDTHTKDEVLAAFDKAIELAEKEQ